MKLTPKEDKRLRKMIKAKLDKIKKRVKELNKK